MKWFENDSHADLDPKIQALIERYGNDGVGVMWRTWCLVARVSTGEGKQRIGWSVDSSGKAYPVEDLARNAGVSVERFEEIMTFLAHRGHLSIRLWLSKKIVCLPAMIKRADEYTKRKLRQENALQAPDVRRSSGDRPVTIPNTTIQDIRSDRSTAAPRRRTRKVDLQPSPLFAEFWSALPKGMKVAKQAAIEAWDQLKIDGKLDSELFVRETLIPALTSQAAALGWCQPGGSLHPHPSTWLRGKRWQDEVTPRRFAAASSRATPSRGATGAAPASKSAQYAALAEEE